jgi:glycosyltransferase involved in cell wall biosynthesis
MMKLLAMIEASTVTGPAKPLLAFCQAAPEVSASIVTFQRGRNVPALVTYGAKGQRDQSGGFPNRFVEAAVEAGLQVDVVGERFRFDPRVLRTLGAVMANRCPDILETHNLKSHFLARTLCAKRRCAWIALQHGYTATDLKMRAYNVLDRWSLPAADRVIAVCGAFGRALTAAGVSPERIAVQHNCITPSPPADNVRVTALRSELGLVADEQVVLAVGRLSREKGHLVLLQALDVLRHAHPNGSFKAVIVGDGPERPALEAAVAKLGLQFHVIFAGQQDDVLPYFHLADVMVLPSYSEGSPLVLLEAMAARVPVVATSVGGVPEIVDHEHSALLAPAGDPTALATAIQRVLGDRPLANRLAEHAYADVVSKHSVAAYVQARLEIYQQVLLERRPAVASHAAPVGDYSAVQ